MPIIWKLKNYRGTNYDISTTIGLMDINGAYFVSLILYSLISGNRRSCDLILAFSTPTVLTCNSESQKTLG